MKHRWGLLAACAVLLLLGGCGVKSVSQTAVPTTAGTAAPGAEVQSSKERQLVMLFQALLQLDRQPGLAISKEQAEALLPIIRQTKEAGSVSEADQKQVVALLTPEQQAFYDQQAQNMKARINGGGTRRSANLSPEEREKLIEQFKQRKDAGGDAPAYGSRPPGAGQAGMGKSVEQQLIELLESKVKP